MTHSAAATGQAETSFPKNRIEVLFLEGLHDSANRIIEGDGFRLETMKGALDEAALIERIASVHILGIRSKTLVTDKVLAAAKRLLTIGCFCIGTNQVDLKAANRRGVPVFNAPFSNTRSVAELVLAEVILLARRLPDRMREMHSGLWKKVASGSHEVRGKTLGIVGYGHIGTQVGILAESLGMRVVFYDIAPRLPIGNNQAVGSLEELLSLSDFVTLHVPETELTRNLIDAVAVSRMRPGSYLINLARGTVVDVPAVAEALRSKQLAGAAFDVFPEEPQASGDPFTSELQGLPNVILTPHIGGSTEEAQEAIGREVAGALVKFVNTGSTTGAVNFPQIDPPLLPGRHRILNVHRNVPGVLSAINSIVSEMKANIEGQVLATDPQIGYLVMDLDRTVSEEVRAQVAALDTNIRTRILY
jgi:D-3-phosphoglycerate dehydrogenase